jgi:carboxyl-terminal processing protease
LLDSAVKISSLFVAEGKPVVIEQSADGTEKIQTASGSSPLQAMPTVVLINGGSASAAEIFAGALHDHELATLIGTTSFGKGSVQELFNLKDGALVKLTIAHWLTPDRHQINKRGIDPDYEIKPGKDDFPGKQDAQLDAAVQYVVNKDAFLKKHTAYVAPATTTESDDMTSDSQ